MTSGLVVVLGETGRNFGAGMSSGQAFVLDEAREFRGRYNREMVTIERVVRDEDQELLQSLISEHLDRTGSPKAKDILQRWEQYQPQFWKIVPKGHWQPNVASGPSATDVKPVPTGVR